MVLGRGLEDDAGRRHAMAGLLPLESSFKAPQRHLGYRRAVLTAPGPLRAPGAPFRGPAFLYSPVLVDEGRAATGPLRAPTGRVGQSACRARVVLYGGIQVR